MGRDVCLSVCVCGCVLFWIEAPNVMISCFLKQLSGRLLPDVAADLPAGSLWACVSAQVSPLKSRSSILPECD